MNGILDFLGVSVPTSVEQSAEQYAKKAELYGTWSLILQGATVFLLTLVILNLSKRK